MDGVAECSSNTSSERCKQVQTGSSFTNYATGTLRNQAAKFIERHTQKPGIPLTHPFDQIQQDVGIPLDFPEDCRFRQWDLVTSRAREDVIDIPDQALDLFVVQKHDAKTWGLGVGCIHRS